MMDKGEEDRLVAIGMEVVADVLARLKRRKHAHVTITETSCYTARRRVPFPVFIVGQNMCARKMFDLREDAEAYADTLAAATDE